jgi:hypothetical protein
VPGVAEAGDGFGTAVAVGGFGDGGNAVAVGVPGEDVLEDLGIGAPGERVGGAAGASAVSVLVSTGPGGLGGAGRQFLYQGAGGLAGAAEPGDGFRRRPRHHRRLMVRAGKEQPAVGWLAGQVMRRRTQWMAASSRSTATTTNRAVSMVWNSQNRSAGWKTSWL